MTTQNITRQANSYKHGGCAGGRNSAEYNIYADAKRRCVNPKRDRYEDYGGRGIEFRFTSFREFIAHIGLRPSAKHSLDRIDNNGHYEIGNVRWATRAEQTRNTRQNQRLTYKGETRIQEDWFKEYPSARCRLQRGWCVDCAIGQPLRGTCAHR